MDLEKNLLGFLFRKGPISKGEFNQRLGLRGFTKKEARSMLKSLIIRRKVKQQGHSYCLGRRLS